MITAVFDTNIYISAIGFDNQPEHLIRLAHQHIFTLYTSPDINAEISSILSRKLLRSHSQITRDIQMIEYATELVFPLNQLNVVKNDPSDNKILECALSCHAHYIVSGDKKHLLPLKKFNDTKIITVSEFLAILRK